MSCKTHAAIAITAYRQVERGIWRDRPSDAPTQQQEHEKREGTDERKEERSRWPTSEVRSSDPGSPCPGCYL